MFGGECFIYCAEWQFIQATLCSLFILASSSLEKQTSFPAADEGMRARLNSQEANVSPQGISAFGV